MNIAVPSEHSEQVAFCRWFRLKFPRVLIFAVPNGMSLGGNEHQRAWQMAKLRAAGLVPGVPDLLIPEWHIAVEMKRQAGGRLSAEQKAIHPLFEAIGWTVIVAKGWEDARDRIMAIGAN